MGTEAPICLLSRASLSSVALTAGVGAVPGLAQGSPGDSGGRGDSAATAAAGLGEALPVEGEDSVPSLPSQGALATVSRLSPGALRCGRVAYSAPSVSASSSESSSDRSLEGGVGGSGSGGGGGSGSGGTSVSARLDCGAEAGQQHHVMAGRSVRVRGS